MIKKLLIFTIIFYLLAIFQSSFFTHFNILNRVPNIALGLLIILNLIEPRESKTGIILAFVSGFFLDMFSARFIGFNIAIMIAASLFIKIVFKKYVRLPFIEEN